MPRRGALTHPQIAAAALSVIDREGLEGLSMRAVAAELGVGTMSLYRYVDDRTQVETLVVDLVLRTVDLRLPARISWNARVATLVARVRDALGDHPSVVPLLLVQRHASEGSMRVAEALHAALASGGFGGRHRAIAVRTLLSYTVGAIQSEHFAPVAPVPEDGRHALLMETAVHARRVSPEERFRRGLDVVLRGLETDAGAQQSAVTRG